MKIELEIDDKELDEICDALKSTGLKEEEAKFKTETLKHILLVNELIKIVPPYGLIKTKKVKEKELKLITTIGIFKGLSMPKIIVETLPSKLFKVANKMIFNPEQVLLLHRYINGKCKGLDNKGDLSKFGIDWNENKKIYEHKLFGVCISGCCEIKKVIDLSFVKFVNNNTKNKSMIYYTRVIIDPKTNQVDVNQISFSENVVNEMYLSLTEYFTQVFKEKFNNDKKD